jgi:hypothetical protein
MPLISTTTTHRDPSATGPVKIERNAKGVPILGPNGKAKPLGANGKPVKKGGKTRKVRRYSRRR